MSELDHIKTWELPNSWCYAKLEDIGCGENAIVDGPFGSNLKVSDYVEDSINGVPVLTTKNLEGDYSKGSVRYISQKKYEELKRSKVQSGDILVAKIGSIGKTGIYPVGMKTAIIPANLLKFTVTSSVEFNYVFSYLNCLGFQQYIKLISTATAQPAFNVTKFRKLPIPLPPKTEQHRIVAKIEELFSELDKGIENLKTARAQLKVYRQALLKHAFEGKLTAQWRAENQGKLETADALLKRIQQERAQRYQQQLADWESAGKQGSKPKAPKPLPPLTTEELAELPELPEGWKFESLPNLIMEVADVDHKMPKAQRDGIPYISTKDFFDQEAINYEMAKRISTDDYENLCKKIKPEYLDLLLSRYGTVGEVRKVSIEGDFQASYSIAIIKTLKNRPELIDYLKWGIRSEVIQKQIRKYVRATAQPDLGLVHIRQLAIPVPACEEQKQIVDVLEARLSEVDQLELTITTALQQAEALRQSILKKAFSGRLVPQDPHDEPASKLLARIKAERETAKESLAVPLKGRTVRKSNVQKMHIANSNYPEIPDSCRNREGKP